MEKYYVIYRENLNKANSKASVIIQEKPGKKNLSNEICTDGWLGTTNGLYEYAYGVYDTFEDAEKFISTKWKSFKKRAISVWY